MSAALDRLPEEERRLIRRAPAPRNAGAMKATLTDERFSDPGWIFERKLDGIRCIAIRDGNGVRLLSRNDLSLNTRYPELAEALDGESCGRFAVDGEVVAFSGGRTSFAALARRGQRNVAVFLYVFDVLWLDGYDVRALPLRSRKRLLRGALDFKGPVRLTPHRNRDGEAFYAEACRKGWEGLIAKRADSPYTTSRSRDWLKLKCDQAQEFVIGGYTAPKGSRENLGALLVGYYEQGALRYAGKVGTGYDRATLELLQRKLAPLHRRTSPFAPGPAPTGEVQWVTPRLVVEIGFGEWTPAGLLRHPRYLGLREDKTAAEVRREG